MNIPETFYIALCVTILMLGIVYWFWTQVQYLQRKVNLLDNVVYEMKTFITNLPGTIAQPPSNNQNDNPVESTTTFQNEEKIQNENNVPTAYNPPPESVAGDLEAERMASEIEFEPFSGENNNNEEQPKTIYSELSDESEQRYVNSKNNIVDAEIIVDDLQPGGLASGIEDVKKVTTFTDSAIESPLNSMSIKELRRMAEANSIPGFAELRKRDLIKALREKVGQIIGQDQNERVLSFDDIGAPNSE